MTEENPILVEIKDRVAVITINRPDVLNALNIPTLQALGQVFDKVETNDDVRVIIFTGAGERAFVAGADIADINARQGLNKRGLRKLPSVRAPEEVLADRSMEHYRMLKDQGNPSPEL